MTVDKDQNKNNNVDLKKKTMECGEDKLPYVPHISSLTPALCGFQLPVSEQNSLFFLMWWWKAGINSVNMEID